MPEDSLEDRKMQHVQTILKKMQLTTARMTIVKGSYKKSFEYHAHTVA